ncbi:thioesterase domain-containing protein [Aliamphritea ceti]|uniref:thioesterase domain-containing protein n=1 Tax=Aliamphritea ceti TaxID=1524258 RepID=UPI0021C32353|nr:thioesterase domain-containing protein [Aliamphritea ceti]
MSDSLLNSYLDTDPEKFLPWLQEQIPLLNHMGMKPLHFADNTLVMAAELAPNVNDKGTGFGGSLATLATLCGWALVTLKLRSVGLDCDVMIRDSQLKYLAPVTGDFAAQAELPKSEWPGFIHYLQEKGRSRVTLNVVIMQQGESPALTLTGTYVALIR